MTSPGRYAASDNSFTRSTATAAARGGALIVIAIVIGVLLLWQGFDGADTTDTDDSDIPQTDGEGDQGQQTPTTAAPERTDDVSDETTSTTTTTVPVVIDPPNSVKVAVLNGRGVSGLAGSRSNHLKTAGYVSIAANADTSDKELSRVYYTPGYEDEAELVAVALNGSPSVIEAAPADPLTLVAETYREATADYHIYVVLGADAVLG